MTKTSTSDKDTQCILYSLDDEGPLLSNCLNTEKINYSDLFAFSNYLYLAIGMGQARNYGLYELPVPFNKRKHAYVYAFDTLDYNLKDERHRGRNYCMLVFIVNKKFRKVLPHSFILERIIEKFLVPYVKFEQVVKSDFLEKAVFTFFQNTKLSETQDQTNPFLPLIS